MTSLILTLASFFQFFHAKKFPKRNTFGGFLHFCSSMFLLFSNSCDIPVRRFSSVPMMYIDEESVYYIVSECLFSMPASQSS